MPKPVKKVLPLSQVYRHLEPGPVILVTTANKQRTNVMTMSWQTMLDFEPPLAAMVISNRNDSFNILKSTKECVLNIPTAKLAKAVIGCSNVSGRDVADKFARFGLTPVSASLVRPPLIAECYANLECRVVDARFIEMYNLFIIEFVKAWIDPKQEKSTRTLHHRGMGQFMVAGRTIKLPSKMK